MRLLLRIVAPLGLLASTATLVAAQGTELGRQTLGRPYWHLFLAYAITLILIGGLAVSIARRLARLERRLDEDGPSGQ
jgi:CcmD family protein